ncbi:hypothetical protein F3Y22_tig00110328pilonHSYRG00544 [Hibiscus syriacus]|uniref:Uncharacterized protein n=1 Tax=Hibiscus syriacus TaxID=106335 RepID=A0A6A3B0U9_HIBSY|nr:hypothetical protein F3Y22_tig00110328pilonHSYRG00544 [Hibiscus syriacus]
MVSFSRPAARTADDQLLPSDDQGGGPLEEGKLTSPNHGIASDMSFFERYDVVLQEGDVVIVRSGVYPMIQISNRVHDSIDKNIKRSIVVHLLGRTSGYPALWNKIKTLWQPQDLCGKQSNEKNVEQVNQEVARVEDLGRMSRSGEDVYGPWMMAPGTEDVVNVRNPWEENNVVLKERERVPNSKGNEPLTKENTGKGSAQQRGTFRKAGVLSINELGSNQPKEVLKDITKKMVNLNQVERSNGIQALNSSRDKRDKGAAILSSEEHFAISMRDENIEQLNDNAPTERGR